MEDYHLFPWSMPILIILEIKDFKAAYAYWVTEYLCDFITESFVKGTKLSFIT